MNGTKIMLTVEAWHEAEAGGTRTAMTASDTVVTLVARQCSVTAALPATGFSNIPLFRKTRRRAMKHAHSAHRLQ